MRIADLEIRCSPSIGGEVDIAAGRVGLRDLADAIENGIASIRTPWNGDPAPYARVLREVVVRVDPGTKVSFEVAEWGDALWVSGDRGALDALAEDIRGMAEEAGAAAHAHLDYHPDHWYLADGSISVVRNIVEG
ncbi:Imm32 family immunity protein [Actinokineospora xionganensis]|uniref:Uncharacterized protein n=1 Tax=Actinokineospora xionganensis TaxID=2684470 RepID=A0ABR7L580_9PSEU|nr:hypothetical protein [Actinokineospora xionganensis]MBC6447838.1 hypothetical protein [Actinokineospora xionganensis]